MKGFESYYMVKYRKGEYIQAIALCFDEREARRLVDYFSGMCDGSGEYYYYDKLLISDKIIDSILGDR